MKTTITLEDIGTDGLFEARVVYEGEGFEPSSVSHVLGHQLMQHLDGLAKREGQETIFGNAPSGHAEQLSDTASTEIAERVVARDGPFEGVSGSDLTALATQSVAHHPV